MCGDAKDGPIEFFGLADSVLADAGGTGAFDAVGVLGLAAGGSWDGFVGDTDGPKLLLELHGLVSDGWSDWVGA